MPNYVVTVFAALIALTLLGAAPKQVDTIAEIDRQVKARFYAPAILKEVDWEARVEEARRAVAQAKTDADRTAVYRRLLASLHSSHTQYYDRTDPYYWYLAGTFETLLRRQCKEHLPQPLKWQEIGVEWVPIENRWFVGGLFAEGPAEKAGLRLGDEVLSADGRPFQPVLAFQGRGGKPVKLSVRRKAGAAPMSITVVPRTSAPQRAFAEAIAKSAKVIERNGKRLGYLHIWSWAGEALHEEVLDAIADFNEKKVDGVILDLRHGLGGASPSYLSLFDTRVPVMEARDRNGKLSRWDAQIRVPTVFLINSRSRSGKEIVAFGAKKHKLAHLVGERTAGAVLAGTPVCLPDGGLLYLAVLGGPVDGVVLEGNGVQPDTSVPFDLRYAAGRDPQLEAGITHLAPRR